MQIIGLLKISIAACAGIMATLYAVQNILNIEQAYGYVAFAFSQQGHEAYPFGLIPPITAAPLIWLALGIIISLEFAAGLLSLLGAFRMFLSRSDAPAFAAAKGTAMLGAGLGVIVWFGLFHGVASAGLQLWQTEAADAVLGGAFQYAVFCFLTLIFLAQKEG